MDYISSYGQSAGPIRINLTWLSTFVDKQTTFNEYGTAVDTNYFVIGSQRQYTGETKTLTPLLAGTPILGWTETGKSCAPANAVATIEWVRLYAQLGEGNDPFNPSDYVKHEELILINNSLADIRVNVNNLNTRMNATENLVSNIEGTVNAMTSQVYKNTSDIATNKSSIESFKENPFPNGLWLKCGDSAN